MKDYEIRIAQDEEGPKIGELASVCGFEIPGMDWSEVYPYWLSAWRGDVLLAAVQVLPGKPVGRIEILIHRPDLEPMDRARIVGEILETGLNVLGRGGAKFISGLVPFGAKSYKRALKKRGGIVFDSGHIIYMAV